MTERDGQIAGLNQAVTERIVDVIVPIYRGVEQTRRCLESVIRANPSHPYRLVLIEDASPDPEMAPMLAAFAAAYPRVELLRNETNLGFFGTVNRGMALHPDADCVLLNSDTEVANDWLDRMVAAAYSHERVGTVTPFSNNATICSFPRFCHDNPLPLGASVAEIDAVCAAVNCGERIDVPTAVGFCMYIRRDCLDDVGLFDQETYGRGYGEENDFCMRATGRGWRHLLATDCFVFHEGSVSFSTEKKALIEHAQRTIDRLYPHYHALVHTHIDQDPARRRRLRVLVELYRRSPRPKLLFLTHHLGGGAEKHVRELAAHLQGLADILVLRPRDGGGAVLSFGTEAGSFDLAFQLPSAYPDLLALLKILGIAWVHFHHTIGLETLLLGLPRDLGVSFDVTVHDYYLINANPTQTDAQGRYTEVLADQRGDYPLSVSIDEWQRNQEALLLSDGRVICPSAAALAIMVRHFPAARYLVAFHPDHDGDPYPAVRLLPLSPGEPLRVLVLGALSREKGADLLEDTAVAALTAGISIEFHLLGYAYRPLAAAVITHGAYNEAEQAGLIQSIRPHVVWFPALCPETYSYTLSEAMRAGLPVVVPDIGAFAERVANRPLTWVRRWFAPPAAWVDFFANLRVMIEGPGRTEPWPEQPLSPAGPGFYRKDYLAPLRAVIPAPADWAQLNHLLVTAERDVRNMTSLTRNEKYLLILDRLRCTVMGRVLASVIPYRLQRRLKRRLSRRPLHEIRRQSA